MPASAPIMKPAAARLAYVFLILSATAWLLASLVTLAAPESHSYLPMIFHRQPSPTPSPGRALISEVLFNPTGDEPDSEWIEIYNAGDFSLDMGGYQLGDEETQGGSEGMFEFPLGVGLPARQVWVIAARGVIFRSIYGRVPDFELRNTDPAIPDLIKVQSWSSGNVELENGGDEVLLLNPANQVVDTVSWGSSLYAFDPSVPRTDDGHSIERSPAYRDRDLAVDWIEQEDPFPWGVDESPPTPVPTSTRRPTATITPAGPADLKLSEVLAAPQGVSGAAGEWIEIYNNGAGFAALERYRLGDEETPGGGEGMLAFPTGAVLWPGQAAVIANQATIFYSLYDRWPDFEMVDTEDRVPDLIPDETWATGNIYLSDSGDEVLLVDSTGDIVDAVSWGSSHWAFDPPVPATALGSSMERYPADRDTDSAADWRILDQPAPGDVTVSPPPTATPTPTFTSTATATPTPGASPTPPPLSPLLLLSEVMVDPVGSDYMSEWFELYNRGEVSVNLTSIKIGDEETLQGGEGMYVFPPGRMISPGQVMVIAYQATTFSSIYGFLPDYELSDTDPFVPQLAKYQSWSGGDLSLNNNGDELLLLDGTDQVIDTLSWCGSTWAFDPAAPCAAEGSSLARAPADLDRDSAADWVVQPVPHPGSVD